MSSRKITYSSHSNHAARSAHARGGQQFKTYDTSHIRPKKSKVPVIFSIVLALVVLGLVLWGGTTFLKSCSAGLLTADQSVEITIPEESGARDIGILLQKEGVIENSTEFIARVNELGVAGELRPGVYTFNGGMTLDDIIAKLRLGPVVLGKTFTVPEGFTIQATADRVAESFEGKISAADFVACANNAAAYEAEFPFVAGAYNNSLEGFLFPKTYPVTEGATADSVVRMMLAQYQIEIASLDYSYVESLGLNRNQVLVMASIIEKEAAADNRATVASVFYNRLAADMRLQSDATTAFVVGRDPSAEDIENDFSPYSTYNNPGLPPGPICSPGLACLQAACAPEATAYLYFYFKEVDGQMVYYFSETLEDHNAAIFS
ncbi:MAG: endolytic transglycosylase MltG [Coriobacteriaceae bacterium]|jgi:UPF0755 protein|nr:endolytic transglycosylase MltG [Coriobacteriaceae bacterium]